MLYPARCKQISVHQSKVLKKKKFDCSVFKGPPGIERDVVVPWQFKSGSLL